jgi:hypothetical protein
MATSSSPPTSRVITHTSIQRHIVNGKFLFFKLVALTEWENDVRIDRLSEIGVTNSTSVLIHPIGNPDGKIWATLIVFLEIFYIENICSFPKQRPALAPTAENWFSIPRTAAFWIGSGISRQTA